MIPDNMDSRTYGDIDLSVEIGSIKIPNPVIACSGTFSHGEDHQPFYDISVLGAITTKSYSLKPKKGNPGPRICETASGVLNSIGLQNDGIDAFVSSHLMNHLLLFHRG